ncbi:hypothetical protein [Variovorax sp. GB1P17]|uniref:hypothetical protein n=1 Tax=Variovorax sp. GB1P17 TaxID=3443740 RepID=UPI003F44BDFF
MTDPIDYSKLSTDELFAQITPRTTGPVPTDAPAPVALGPAVSAITADAAVTPPTTSPIGTTTSAPTLTAALAAGNTAEPDYSKMSTEDLFALLPAAPTAAPQRSALERFGHGVGVGVRGLVEGVASLPGLVTDNLIAKPVNAALDLYDEKRTPAMSELVTGKQPGFRLQPLEQAAGNLLTGAGVGHAENGWERVAQDASRGASAALTGVGAGNVLAQAAGPITRALGAGLSAAPGIQVVSGAASGATREAGGGAVAQTVAGLAGAIAPTAVPFAAQAGLRGAIRGGEAGRQQMADNIATFEGAAGTTPTLGQATQSRSIQGIETGLTNVIGGHGIMVKKAEQQAQALQQSVQDLGERLAPGANATTAGEAITRGVATFRDNVRETQQRLYNNLDRFVSPDAPVTVGNTRAAMEKLNASIEGAPEISKWFVNGQLSALEKALVSDLETALAKSAPPGSRSSLMNPAPPNLDAAALPFEAVKQLRSLVGRTMSDTNMLSPIGRNKWAPVYAALSEDLGKAAKAAGPQAEQAWTRANTFTRLANERMEQISSIINKDAPEHIFRAATSGLADGGTQIRRLMKSMPVENRQEVAAAVLQRLGRARNSAQDEMGSVFSSETFLTNLAAMSPAARNALFTSSGFPGLQQSINQMGRMAAVRRESSTVFANPSGTARQVGLGGWWLELGKAIGSGNPVGIAKVLAVPTLARGAAKLATSPGVVEAIAKRSTLSPAITPAAASALAQAPNVEPRKDTILDGSQPFTNRMRAGKAAKEAGGTVMPHPRGGFYVLRPLQERSASVE